MTSISRRSMLQQSVSALAASCAMGGKRSRSADKAAPPEGKATLQARDKYGGCPDIRFKATGFFRLEHADRWWLVTPDGNAFLSFGLNHVTLQNVRLPYNEQHWLNEFHAKDASDPAFKEGFRKKVRQDLDAFGFNTLGTHSPTKWYPRGFCPYVHQVMFVNICHWQLPTEKDFPDVFSDEFAAYCDKKAKAEAEPVANDPYVLGYSMSDCPIFTNLDAAARKPNLYGSERIELPTWPNVLRNMAKETPGKYNYVRTMREVYIDNVGRFNETYGTKFTKFNELEEARDWRPKIDRANAMETRDNSHFLMRILDQYYSVATAAIRKYDPNHLILGDKLNGNTDGADFALPLTNKFMDVVFYQTFGTYAEQKPALDRWSKRTGLPLFNGDSSYSVPSETMPDPYGPHSSSQEERAQATAEFGLKAFARPDFVGWNHCGWMDAYSPGAAAGLKQHAGLQTPMGEYHKPLFAALHDLSQQMYDVARSGHA